MLRPPRCLARQLGLPSGLFGRHVMSPFLNRMNAAHNRLILDDLELGSSSRVLEVGFGGAGLLEKLCRKASGGQVAGLELSQEMIAAARIRLRRWIDSGLLELSLGSIQLLPYPDETFDRACTVHTTYFWPNLADGLTELHRVMRPGGRVVLGFLPAADIARAGLERHGFSLHSLEEMKSALLAAHFCVESIRSRRDLRGELYSMVAERF